MGCVRWALDVFTPGAVRGTQEREVLTSVVRGISSGLDDLLLIVIFVAFAQPAMKVMWRTAHVRLPRLLAGKPGPDDTDHHSRYESSYMAALQPAVHFFGKTLAFLWVIDASYIIATALGMANGDGKIPRAVSYVTYTYALGLALTAMKNHMIRGYVGIAKARAQEANEFILRRGSGIFLWAALGLVCMDAISINVGITVGSILSFAGVGGLAVGLATKDLVSNLVGGCLIFLTQPFSEGDKVAFKDLPQSKITRIGW